MSPYIIQLVANRGYCLGVQQASPGSNVVLSNLQGIGNKTTQWELDPNSGRITLAGSANLCLDIQGNSPGNGVQLIVADYVLGRPTQIWNWVGSPPSIMNTGAPGFCVDNNGGNVAPGNKIQLYATNGTNAQQWTELSVHMLKKAARHLP